MLEFQQNRTKPELIRILLVTSLDKRRRTDVSVKKSMCAENRPRSIYQYSNMAPRLLGQNCKFFKFLLSLNSQKRLEYKENNTKYRSLTRKPRSHVRILIYRTWTIEWEHLSNFSKGISMKKWPRQATEENETKKSHLKFTVLMDQPVISTQIDFF